MIPFYLMILIYIIGLKVVMKFIKIKKRHKNVLFAVI